jgi:hypothetical protein
MGCLVILGVVLMGVSCLAVFAGTGAINSTTGPGTVQASAPRPAATKPAVKPAEPEVEGSAKPEPARTEAPAKADAPAKSDAPAKTDSTSAPAKPTEAPKPEGTIPPKPAAAGPEGSIAQRLDREAVGNGLRLKALGAAKTTQGDRAVMAIYVRMENDGTAPIHVDPTYFKLADRSGAKYGVSKVVEATIAAVDLAPRSAPGEQGKQTEGNLTFEIPKAAGGLALTYEPPQGSPLRIPLPPEFG